VNGKVDFEQLGQQLDRSDMLGLAQSFPSHMEDAWGIGQSFAQSVTAGDYQQVVVCGMGGSAIGGDMLRSFFGDRLAAPLTSVRGYRVPAHVGKASLVVVSSYSGNTGETLSAFDSLRGRGATVVAVSGGGNLEERCREDGVPFCTIPGGMPPRAAIAYSFVPMLQILRAAGVARFQDTEFDEALHTARNLASEFAPGREDNPAVELARALERNLPYVYSGSELMKAIARRWACQFNENSKSPAHFADFPELNHNEIVGWRGSGAGDLYKRVVVLSLEDRDDHEMTRHQTEIGLGIEESFAAAVRRFDGGQGGRLSRMISLLMLGDFASIYLAYLYGVDPTPVENIDFLKNRLGQIYQGNTHPETGKRKDQQQ
jgi:glucose/mannose-6-phosphate isomerase